MKIMKLVISNSNNPYMTKICTLKPVLIQQIMMLVLEQGRNQAATTTRI